MNTYLVTINYPFSLSVNAEDEEKAKEKALAQFPVLKSRTIMGTVTVHAKVSSCETIAFNEKPNLN